MRRTSAYPLIAQPAPPAACEVAAACLPLVSPDHARLVQVPASSPLPHPRPTLGPSPAPSLPPLLQDGLEDHGSANAPVRTFIDGKVHPEWGQDAQEQRNASLAKSAAYQVATLTRWVP